jgi:hypothetical protein
MPLGKPKEGKATRDQVEEACTAAGGIAWGTLGSSGQYGCITDNGVIICSQSGDCTYWPAERISQPDEISLADNLRVQVISTPDPTPDPTRLWTESQKVQPAGWQGPAGNPCKTCPEILKRIREIDAHGARLVEEYKTLRKRVASKGIQGPRKSKEAPQEGEKIVQQLQEIAERLSANAAERRILVKQHDAELAEWWVSSQPRLRW